MNTTFDSMERISYTITLANGIVKYKSLFHVYQGLNCSLSLNVDILLLSHERSSAQKIAGNMKILIISFFQYSINVVPGLNICSWFCSLGLSLPLNIKVVLQHLSAKAIKLIHISIRLNSGSTK